MKKTGLKEEMKNSSLGPRKKIAVFISGQGSNLSVFLQHQHLWKDILVVSNNSQAYGLQKAQRFGVSTYILDKPIDWEKLDEELRQQNVDLIFLAGFMKIVPASFVTAWADQLFNLHPSLLPKYKGLRSIEKAYNNKDEIGVSIHKVNAEVDGGEILLQKQAISKETVVNLSLEKAELYVHACEQFLIKEWIEQWA